MLSLEIDRNCFNCIFNHTRDPETGEECNECRCNNRKSMYYGEDCLKVIVCGQWRKDSKSFGSEDK